MRLKLTTLLLSIVVLGGCGFLRQLGDGNGNNDSPIIVSDGSSTHLRHKNATGTGGDFQIVYAGGIPEVTVNDPSFAPQSIECVNITTTPTLACATKPFPTLVAGWKLLVYGQAPPAGNAILTVAAPSAGPQVISNFMGNYIDPQGDTSVDKTQGTDIAEHSVTFASAVFTNGGGASPVTFTCTPGCKVRIHYQ